MLKYYISKDYRRKYTDLQHLGLLSDSLLLLDYSAYESFLEKTPKTLFLEYLPILEQKLTAFRAFKNLLFLHAYLQNFNNIQHTDSLLSFLNKNLLSVRQSSLQSVSKSVVVASKSHLKAQTEIQRVCDILSPYVAYLQKFISNFDISNRNKQYSGKDKAEIWRIMNLFNYVGALIHRLKGMSNISKKYIRAPVALAQACTIDIHKLYPRISRYTYIQASRLRKKYLPYQNEKRGQTAEPPSNIEEIDLLYNLIQDITNLNQSLNVFFSEGFFCKQIHPKYVRIEKLDINFVLQLREKTGETEPTPSFLERDATYMKAEEVQEILNEYFRQIENQQDISITFRKKLKVHNRSKDKQSKAM